jgi:hypothetical protein
MAALWLAATPVLRQHRASARINSCNYLRPANPPSLKFMLNRTSGSAATGPPDSARIHIWFGWSTSRTSTIPVAVKATTDGDDDWRE